jgi:hypothetical protein
MNMQASAGCPSDPDGVAAFEEWLRRCLYRVDCPNPYTLGEYGLGFLEPELRTQVARHAALCDDCMDELQTLRA